MQERYCQFCMSIGSETIYLIRLFWTFQKKQPPTNLGPRTKSIIFNAAYWLRNQSHDYFVRQHNMFPMRFILN